MVLLGRRVGRVVLSAKRYIAIIARMYVIAVTICVWATYTILPTYVKGLNVTVRATGTIGPGFGILRGTLPDTKRQKGMLGLESDLRHYFFGC